MSRSGVNCPLLPDCDPRSPSCSDYVGLMENLKPITLVRLDDLITAPGRKNGITDHQFAAKPLLTPGLLGGMALKGGSPAAKRNAPFAQPR